MNIEHGSITNMIKNYGRKYGKEHTVDTIISNAKVIRYDRPGGNFPRLGVRERAGEDFQGISYDGSLGFRWSEEVMRDTHNVTILEEFPSLNEIVRGAPVFLATDNQGVLWSFSRFRGATDGPFIPTWISPAFEVMELAFDVGCGYREYEIVEKIDLSTVQPLFPRE